MNKILCILVFTGLSVCTHAELTNQHTISMAGIPSGQYLNFCSNIKLSQDLIITATCNNNITPPFANNIDSSLDYKLCEEGSTINFDLKANKLNCDIWSKVQRPEGNYLENCEKGSIVWNPPMISCKFKNKITLATINYSLNYATECQKGSHVLLDISDNKGLYCEKPNNEDNEINENSSNIIAQSRNRIWGI